MATIVPFVPSDVAPPQFQATLDGAAYTIIITWNVFGQRYYINVLDTSGALVLCTALVGSPNGYDIDLLGPLFASTLVYRAPSNQFEISP